jgi:hypothetical protein
MQMLMKKWYTHLLLVLVALISKYPHEMNNYYYLFLTLGAWIIQIINELHLNNEKDVEQLI